MNNQMMKKRTHSKKEKQFYRVLDLFKRRETIMFSDKATNFSSTEMRLLTEILWAKHQGKRLISAQLASSLGLTRSAISQIVNRLEKIGAVRRVPDATDKKIAYVEVTEETMNAYAQDLKQCKSFIGKVVDEFGEERFHLMCDLFDEFLENVEKVKNEKRRNV